MSIPSLAVKKGKLPGFKGLVNSATYVLRYRTLSEHVHFWLNMIQMEPFSVVYYVIITEVLPFSMVTCEFVGECACRWLFIMTIHVSGVESCITELHNFIISLPPWNFLSCIRVYGDKCVTVADL